MRRRMLMDLLSRGDSVIKYGYFEVEPEKASEIWQVNIANYTIEVQTGLNVVPKKIVCTYIDDKEKITERGASMFVGTVTGNAYTNTGTNSNDIRSESVPFTSSDAAYLKFDGATSKIYAHVAQWGYIKCGKWMWIAIYDE